MKRWAMHFGLIAVLLTAWLADPVWSQTRQPMEQTEDAILQSAASGNVSGTTYKNAKNFSSATMQVNIAAGTATVTFQGAQDETNLTALQCVNLSTGAIASSVIASGVYACPTSNLHWINAPITNCAGCTVTVSSTFSTAKPTPMASTTTQGVGAANTAGWPIYGGIVARGSAAWTNATAQNTAVSVNITGYNTIAVFLSQGSTIAGGVVTFEASDDNANWYAVQACRMDTAVCATTYTLQATTNAPFEVDVGGGTNFRVRLSTVITGTATVNVGVDAQALPSEPSTTTFQGTSPWVDNISQVGGTNIVTGGVNGTLGVGGTAGTNAAITQNPMLVGVEARSTTPTAATNGNQRQAAGDLAGNIFEVKPLAFTCTLQALAASLTQCQAAPAAGYSLYITSWIALTTTGTAGTYQVEYGTGSNCGTGTNGVFPSPGANNSRTITAPINTAAPQNFTFPSGKKLPAANALCVIGTATNTIDISIDGFIAP